MLVKGNLCYVMASPVVIGSVSRRWTSRIFNETSFRLGRHGSLQLHSASRTTQTKTGTRKGPGLWMLRCYIAVSSTVCCENNRVGLINCDLRYSRPFHWQGKKVLLVRGDWFYLNLCSAEVLQICCACYDILNFVNVEVLLAFCGQESDFFVYLCERRNFFPYLFYFNRPAIVIAQSIK